MFNGTIAIIILLETTGKFVALINRYIDGEGYRVRMGDSIIFSRSGND